MCVHEGEVYVEGRRFMYVHVLLMLGCASDTNTGCMHVVVCPQVMDRTACVCYPEPKGVDAADLKGNVVTSTKADLVPCH